MGQGGKSGGKPSGKGEKPSGKGGKPSGKTGKSGKDPATKQQNNKNSMSVLASSCCLCIMYSIVMAVLGSQALKVAGDNPQLLAMASDIRLKKNIDTSNYGMNEIMQLKPKSYHYINEKDNGTKHLGLMVQDVSKIMPELIIPLTTEQLLPFGEIDETRYGLKYQELIPVLINAIKELKIEVDELKNKCNC